MQMDVETTMRKTLATYSKLGMRRMAKTSGSKRLSGCYLDLTNLWRTNSSEQNKQYQAIRDSDLFSDCRSHTFLKFNYRNYEHGSYTYSSAHNKVKKRNKEKVLLKGTMQVTDLWSDRQMQDVMGAPAFPRDRLKILKLWGQKKGP